MEFAPDPDARVVFTRTDALRRGVTDDDIMHGMRRGELVRLRPGAYATQVEWRELYAEDRMRADAAAYLDATRGGRVVFSHQTAAALHRIPLLRTRHGPVHVCCDRPARSTARVIRHRMPLPDADVLWSADGRYGVTAVSRTLLDLCATVGVEAAVAAADAALRAHAVLTGSRSLDTDAAEALRAELSARVAQAAGHRGIRTARFVADFADARADSTGESLSRLYLHQLGFPPPGLQVPVPGPAGVMYEVDFDLETVWGEFDGAAKYDDPRYLRGRTPAQVVVDEKAREDWIRGTTGKRIIRWGFEHLADAHALGRRLAAFGLTPPRVKAHPFRE